ncbi:MAG: hypothetical protein L0207_06360 [Chlamydiae bacterium]|nr:hypothetical protein [Chlamydiota bacterium]
MSFFIEEEGLAIRVSNPKEEGVVKVSKFLKIPILLDLIEMEDLLSLLSPFFIFIVSELVDANKALISKNHFLALYQEYVGALQEGRIPDEKKYRSPFSSIFTRETNLLYAHEVKEKLFLIKSIQPIIQLQSHFFSFSNLDQKFHSMVLGKGKITWGVQFSYPQIFQDPKTDEIVKVAGESFPNTHLFHQIQKWVRANTLPTPFFVEGKKVFSIFRLGKKCFSWINSHRGLKETNLQVVVS